MQETRKNCQQNQSSVEPPIGSTEPPFYMRSSACSSTRVRSLIRRTKVRSNHSLVRPNHYSQQKFGPPVRALVRSRKLSGTGSDHGSTHGSTEPGFGKMVRAASSDELPSEAAVITWFDQWFGRTSDRTTGKIINRRASFQMRGSPSRPVFTPFHEETPDLSSSHFERRVRGEDPVQPSRRKAILGEIFIESDDQATNKK